MKGRPRGTSASNILLFKATAQLSGEIAKDSWSVYGEPANVVHGVAALRGGGGG